jgi:predicted small secreted protein
MERYGVPGIKAASESLGLAGRFLMRKTLIIAAAVLVGLSLTACNTVGGAGKDVSSVGKAVTNTANDVKN